MHTKAAGAENRTKVYLNGRFVAAQEAAISLLEPGFLYGFGLFETMRSLDKKIVYFDAHIKRLQYSSRRIGLGLIFNRDKFREIIDRGIELTSLSDAYIRINCWKNVRGNDIAVIFKPYQSPSRKIYKRGYRAYVSAFRQNELSLLSRIKSMNYLLNSLAYSQAKAKGYDEALLLNSRGYISEGSRSNIFLIKDKQVFTPSLECGCLDGVTRRAVLDIARKSKLIINEGRLTVGDLHSADEAFLTNSLIGIMPLVCASGENVGEGSPGRMTAYFSGEYALLLKNGK